MSLRRRLTLVLCAVLLLPLVTVAVMVGTGVPRVATGAVDDRLLTAARSSAAALAARCDSLAESARAVALEAAPAPGGQVDPDVAQEAVAGAVRGRPGTSAAVLGPGGVVAEAGTADLSSSGGLSCAAGDVLPPGGTDPALVQSVPVAGVEGTVTAVVQSALDDEALRLLRSDLGLAGHLVILSQGRALAGTLDHDAADLLAVSAGTSPPTSPADLLGHRVVADQGGRGLGVTVLAVEPGPDRSGLVGAVLGLLLLVALAAVGAVVVLARRLTAPLVELTEVAGRLGGGDLEARTTVRGHDEVARLGSAFNGMADALVAAIVDARSGRAALEDSFQHFGRVLGRTHDLDGLVGTLLEACRSAAGATAGGAWLGEDPPMLRRVAGEGPHRDAMARLASQAVQSGQAVEGTLPGEGAHAVAAVALPLLHQSEVLGAVVVADPEGGSFTPPARAAMLALSQQAGTAVHNVEQHRETQRLSVTDPLTGAGNFRHLSTTLAREVERASRFDRPLSVLMLDLDHFKDVNDTWGHARGDTVLRELARRLGECVREVDTVARYGGEEFALVLPETDVSGAGLVAQRVVDSVGREPFTAPDGPQLTITVSVGVATFPRHGHGAGDVMRAADGALYVAKRSGRDRWCVAGDDPGPEAPAPGEPVGSEAEPA